MVTYFSPLFAVYDIIYAKLIHYDIMLSSIFRLLNDRSGLAKAHSNIANTYKALGDFDSAYEHAVSHLRLAQELNDKVSVILPPAQ